jgi:hypothetical protein
MTLFRGVRRRALLHSIRPVTPEVAGSSPVAPAENILQMHMFCCQDGLERLPAFQVSRFDPA